ERRNWSSTWPAPDSADRTAHSTYHQPWLRPASPLPVLLGHAVPRARAASRQATPPTVPAPWAPGPRATRTGGVARPLARHRVPDVSATQPLHLRVTRTAQVRGGGGRPVHREMVRLRN